MLTFKNLYCFSGMLLSILCGFVAGNEAIKQTRPELWLIVGYCFAAFLLFAFVRSTFKERKKDTGIF